MRFSCATVLVFALGVLGMTTSEIDESEVAVHHLEARSCKVVHPKGKVCGAKGEIAMPKFIKPTHPFFLGKSLKECRDLCLANKKCLSFLYNAPIKQCVPYDKYIVDNGPVYGKELPGVLYDKPCFKCHGKYQSDN